MWFAEVGDSVFSAPMTGGRAWSSGRWQARREPGVDQDAGMPVALAAQRPSRASDGIAFLVPATTVAALALADGGFFPSQWRWAGFLLAAVGLGVVASGAAVEPGRAGRWFLVALAGLVGWSALSALWSESASRSLLEAERGLVLLLGTGAFLLSVRRASLG
jgi:hypothetical protein